MKTTPIVEGSVTCKTTTEKNPTPQVTSFPVSSRQSTWGYGAKRFYNSMENTNPSKFTSGGSINELLLMVEEDNEYWASRRLEVPKEQVNSTCEFHPLKVPSV